MTRYIQGSDRSQVTLLPECLDDFIGEDNPVRVVDVFVDELDLAELGFERTQAAVTGRPGYHRACPEVAPPRRKSRHNEFPHRLSLLLTVEKNSQWVAGIKRHRITGRKSQPEICHWALQNPGSRLRPAIIGSIAPDADIESGARTKRNPSTSKG